MKVGDEFTCAACGETFTALRDDKDAIAEAEKRFGKIAPEERAVVCNDCHLKFLEWIKTQN